MAEACTVLHAENKRSLPAWMLKSCSDNQVVKNEDQNVKASESDEQTRNLDLTKSVKTSTGRRLKQVDLVGAGELGVLQRCEGRAKARKTSKNVVKDGVEEIEEVDPGGRLGKVDSAGDGELEVMHRCTAREKKRMAKNIVKDEVKEIEEVASKNLSKVSEGAVPKKEGKGSWRMVNQKHHHQKELMLK